MTRTTLQVSLLLLASGAAFAQAPTDSRAACINLMDDSSRLKCYDDEMGRLGYIVSARAKGAPVATPAGSFAAAAPAAPATAATPAAAIGAPAAAASAAASAQPGSGSAASSSDEFGFSSETLRKKRAAEKATAGQAAPKDDEKVVAGVTAVTTTLDGKIRVELDNGQVWVETQKTGGNAPKPGENVTLKHGLMGSFFMARSSGLALRVKRIK